MHCNDNFSFIATLNLGFDCVLVYLAIVSLSLYDRIYERLSFVCRAEEHLANFLPICVASELHGIQLLLCDVLCGLCGDDLRFFLGRLVLCDIIHVSHHDFLRAREGRNRLHIKLHLEFIRILALNEELIPAYLHYVFRELSRNALEIGRKNVIPCFCGTKSVFSVFFLSISHHRKVKSSKSLFL